MADISVVAIAKILEGALEMEDFEVKECKECGFEVEEIEEEYYYCHCCEKDLSEDEVTTKNLITDGYVKKYDDGTIEVKGVLNILNLFNS
ncbi:hypothetical protein [uncultured Clostridium sp.]|uniref:hypothetical protein n=1 Tax=uncultured Clostridium sp. TaxID=59620 RepID=UPI0028F107B4|nr:hypothetical protein [uncultured Clostridium sp.]